MANAVAIAAGASVDASVYKTLLESTRAIPWKIDWSTMRFAYIGPQIEELLGWAPDSWTTVQDWADRMHPDDRGWVVDFCVAQSKAGVDHEADYRALNKDGTYVWIRDVVHVVRHEDGSVDALIGFMFDISEQKRTEEKMAHLENELEALSFKDALTGLANRRWFETLIEAEWTIAQRSQRPLSLVRIAVDFFPQYRDQYGSLRADDCLKRVAATLGSGATRPRDFLARVDASEFAVVLPETDESGAQRVAARCRDALVDEEILHEASSFAAHVTISSGVGTVVPARGARVETFLHEVDRRLAFNVKERLARAPSRK